MDDNRFVKLERIISEFSLEVLHGGEDYQNIKIYEDSVDRPGLQLVGYFEHFDTHRVQLIGNMEYGYLANLSRQERLERFDKLFSYPIPALILRPRA